MVFDVWTPQAAFERFGKTLLPILQGVGVDPGQPSVMPMYRVSVPSARVKAKKTSAAKVVRGRAGKKKR